MRLGTGIDGGRFFARGRDRLVQACRPAAFSLAKRAVPRLS